MFIVACLVGFWKVFLWKCIATCMAFALGKVLSITGFGVLGEGLCRLCVEMEYGDALCRCGVVGLSEVCLGCFTACIGMAATA